MRPKIKITSSISRKTFQQVLEEQLKKEFHARALLLLQQGRMLDPTFLVDLRDHLEEWCTHVYVPRNNHEIFTRIWVYCDTANNPVYTLLASQINATVIVELSTGEEITMDLQIV